MPKKQILNFSKDKFIDWEASYWWKPVDDAIYEIFKKPNEANMFRSKLYILSLCYRTNIEMRASIIDIADRLLRSPEYKYVARQLTGDMFKDTIFSENAEIYSLHYKIMYSIKKTTKANESVFVSKFLHFWQPQLFPILDSKAETNLIRHRWVTENVRQLELQYENFFPKLKEDQYDDRYCWFCFLLLQFSNHIQQKYSIRKDLVSLKALDVYLYHICEQ